MNASAVAVVEDLADVVFAYGVSDEYRYASLVRILTFTYLSSSLTLFFLISTIPGGINCAFLSQCFIRINDIISFGFVLDNERQSCDLSSQILLI